MIARGGIVTGAALIAVVSTFAAVVYGIRAGEREVAILGLALAGVSLGPLLAAWRASLSSAVVALSFFVAVSVGATHVLAGRAFEAMRSMKPLAPLLATIRPEDPLVVCNLDKPGVIFYSHRFVEITDSIDDVALRLREGRRAFAIVRDGKLGDLLRRMDGDHDVAIEVVWRQESWSAVRARP